MGDDPWDDLIDTALEAARWGAAGIVALVLVAAGLVLWA